MCADEVACGKRADERELTGHDGGGDNASELLRVLARVGEVCALDAEHLEDGALGRKNGSTTDGADFNRRHRHCHQ